MAFATFQATQGAVVGNSGESVAGFDTSTAITLTDDGGAGATSYLWECISFPGPDSAAPVITNSALQVATITPGGGGLTDGMYVIRLTRNDPGDGVSTDVHFFAVENNDGHSLPSAAVNRNMTNIGGALAQAAGWFGREDASTNFFLDAFLRLRKQREGRYFGQSLASTHASGSITTVIYTYDQDLPFQDLTMAAAGTGEYRADLDLTDAEDGSVFRFRVDIDTLAGDFVVRNGSGGSTILTLTAPPLGLALYEVVAVFNGTAWQIFTVQLIEPLGLVKEREFLSVAGVHENSTDVFARIGTLRIDPSVLPTALITWEASFETSDAGNDAEIRLYNTSDVAVVASSTFTTSSTTLDTQSVAVTLPASLKEYEVQLRLTAADPAERATCTRARVVLSWA